MNGLGGEGIVNERRLHMQFGITEELNGKPQETPLVKISCNERNY